MKKGVARVATNIKSMSGVPGGTIATLPIGGWVFGNLSPTGSDLIDILEWYRPSGEKMPLSVSCKASAANLTLSDASPETPPDNPPEPTDEEIIIVIDKVDGTVTSITVDGEEWSKSDP